MTDPSASTSQGSNAQTGVDCGRVSAWFAQNIPGVALPLQSRRVAGGRSNLTFEVRDASGVGYVLRRRPVSHALPTVHDIQREFRIVAALGPAGVPVPAALGLYLDQTVNGAPFYVMASVDGIVARSDLAFAYWRLACILEGAYSRYVVGAMGDDGFDFSVYPDSTAWLGAQARHLATRVHDKD
jgi:hypothetical protein